MVVFLLLYMFLAGIVQVIWAFVQSIITRFKQVRKHFAFYGLGVVAYFLILGFLYLVGKSGETGEMSTMFVVHFLAGAAALYVYHIWIVALSFRLLREKDEAALMAEWD